MASTKNPTPPRFDGLRALFLNCTLKRSPERSHTAALIDASMAIMRGAGVDTECLRPVDHRIATGMQRDMTGHGWDHDDWPALLAKVLAADILVIGTPIWLGDKSSVCTQVIERLYSASDERNRHGQYLYYGRAGGALTTGNEDGGKRCGRDILYALQRLGYLVPPQADAYWVGEAGPGPSYMDRGRVGRDNDFTNRTVTVMSWNLMHAAAWLKAQGGMPRYGNQLAEWEKGRRFGHPYYAAKGGAVRMPKRRRS